MTKEEAVKNLDAMIYNVAIVRGAMPDKYDIKALRMAIEALKAQEWIPVKWHYITDEEREREGYPKDWAVHLDCEMPVDEQEILVTTKHGYVEKDVCHEDGCFSLDSGWDWMEDIVAWMPLPKPYKAESEDKG